MIPPDRDLLIGPRFKPFYEADRVPGLGVSTWPPDQRKIGGGSVWGWISYDSTMDAIFHGTSGTFSLSLVGLLSDSPFSNSPFGDSPDGESALGAPK